MKTFVQEKASPLPVDIQSESHHKIKVNVSASRKIIIPASKFSWYVDNLSFALMRIRASTRNVVNINFNV